ncbi:Elongation of fatty acids protein sre1, partial [Dictyocoela roeselum]
VWNIVWKHLKSQSFINFLSDKEMYLRNSLCWYIYLFYLSKYYELVDTIILHINKKRASFLQTYHHAGAIIATFLLTNSKTQMGWIFISLNTFVHSIMYLYFAFTCIGIRFKYKHFITNMQIMQFLAGIVLLGMHLLFAENPLSDGVDKYANAFTVFFNLFYVVVLIVLFNGFFKRTYGDKRKQE